MTCLRMYLALLGALWVTQALAGDPGATAARPQPPDLAVFLPERIDETWYWVHYSELRQHLVQSALEKALVEAGHQVAELTGTDVFEDKARARDLAGGELPLRKAAALGIPYILSGRAEAIPVSHGSAYGVEVYRYSAEITAQLVRVQDGAVLFAVEAKAMAGGESAMAAGRAALQKASALLVPELLSRLAQHRPPGA